MSWDNAPASEPKTENGEPAKETAEIENAAIVEKEIIVTASDEPAATAQVSPNVIMVQADDGRNKISSALPDWTLHPPSMPIRRIARKR
jgi:hypothetical protein